jgi:beta-galactosidase beta subunit
MQMTTKTEETLHEKNDVFYKNAPDIFLQLTDNQFAIFFPNDVHAPMIGTDNIKKVEIGRRYRYCAKLF